MIDLHTHSSASDGYYSPCELLNEASRIGLKALALTDHDTLDGLNDAKKAASAMGITFIPGVELQINWKEEKDPGTNKGYFHLLGLGIDRPSVNFLSALAEMREERKNRNFYILEKMKKAGINVSYDDILAFSGGEVVGRLHFAKYLIANKIAADIKQAFDRYLAPGKKFYVPKAGMDFDEAAELIRESGGLSVLAHPLSLYVSWGQMPELFKDLKNRGLDGIEAWHPMSKKKACMRLEELGKKIGLKITAGSDFHGVNRPDQQLGYTAGGEPIKEKYLEELIK